MCKILQNQVVLFVLAAVCWCNQTICATSSWRALDKQDTADINALLPSLATAGQGLWIIPRANPPAARPTETLRFHYKIEHGARGSHDKTLPFFNGALVAPVVGANPAPAEEVVMARFIASLAPPLPPGSPSVVPPTALVRKKDG